MKLALIGADGHVENISVAEAGWSLPGWVEYTDENPAHIGGDYVGGVFYPPQPFDSWVRDAERGTWVPPVAIPGSEDDWAWDEPTLSWVAR